MMDSLGKWEKGAEGHGGQTHWRRSAETALGEIGEDIFRYGNKYQAEVHINEYTIKWKADFGTVKAAQEWCDETLRPAIEQGIEDLKKLI